MSAPALVRSRLQFYGAHLAALALLVDLAMRLLMHGCVIFQGQFPRCPFRWGKLRWAEIARFSDGASDGSDCPGAVCPHNHDDLAVEYHDTSCWRQETPRHLSRDFRAARIFDGLADAEGNVISTLIEPPTTCGRSRVRENDMLIRGANVRLQSGQG